MTTTPKHYQHFLITSVLSLLLFIEATAQSKDHPLMVSLTGGLSFPVGRFADNNVATLSTGSSMIGAAGTGWTGNIQIGYRLNTHFGIALTGGVSEYKRDGSIFAKYYELIYGNKSTVDSKQWSVVKVLAGPTYTATLSKKLSFRSGLSAGIVKTAIPDYSFTINGPMGEILLERSAGKAKMPAAFAYQANAGLGYELSKKVMLLFDVNYFDATATDNRPPSMGRPIMPSPNPQPAYAQVEEKYKLSAFSATLGIGFRL
ncbi:MAG: outer membrane beta-barrel protein [Sphingobacteriales bacterium]|nr:outer membrane beta-barrel protein [Sphingobacteriales bacterium]OJV97682.1 MAG: hypothetical protein BGO52_09890 [Sphingobacteriales bacterium 44-61]